VEWYTFHLPLIAELLTAVMALVGFASSVALLILNLKVSSAVAGVRIEIANLRVEHQKEAADHYREVMSSMTTLVQTLSQTFANREAFEEKHKANLQRLESIDHKLMALAQQVQDIG